MDLDNGSSVEEKSFGEKTKHLTLRTLFRLSEDSHLGRKAFIASIVVSTLQLLNTLLDSRTGIPWPIHIQNVLEPLLRAVSLCLEDNYLTKLVMISLNIGFLFVGFIKVCIMDPKSQKKDKMTRMGTATLARLNQFILLGPSLFTLSQAHVELKHSLPSSTSQAILQAGMTLLTFAYLLVLFLFVLTQIHTSAVDKNAKNYAAAHARFEALSFALRAAIFMYASTMETNSLEDSTAYRRMLIALILFSSGTLTTVYAYFLPFYNPLWNRLCVASYTTVSWAGVCAIVAESVNAPSDYSAGLLLCVTSVFCIISAVSLVQLREVQLEKLDFRNNNQAALSPYVLEACLRLRHIRKEGAGFSFAGDVEKDYKDALECFPESSFLCLLISGLVRAGSKKMILSLNLIRRARKARRSFDTDYCLFAVSENEKQRADTSSGDISFVQCEEQLSVAKAALIKSLKTSLHIWKKVEHGTLEPTKLTCLSDTVQSHLKVCHNSIAKLERSASFRKEALQLKALVQQYVLNDNSTALRLMTKASSLGTSVEGSGPAICVISGDLSTLGTILDVSRGLLELFGYGKRDLLGVNVSMLCPPPLDAVHDRFLQQFVESDAEFAEQARSVWGMHQAGYIMPLDLKINPSINANGELLLIGTFKRKPTRASSHLLLVDGISKCVTGATKDACQELRVEEDLIFALSLTVDNLIPDWEQLTNSQNSSTSRRSIEHQHVRISTRDDARFTMKCTNVSFANKPDASIRFDVSLILVELSEQEPEEEEGQYLFSSQKSFSKFPSDLTSQEEETEQEEGIGTLLHPGLRSNHDEDPADQEEAKEDDDDNATHKTSTSIPVPGTVEPASPEEDIRVNEVYPASDNTMDSTALKSHPKEEGNPPAFSREQSSLKLQKTKSKSKDPPGKPQSVASKRAKLPGDNRSVTSKRSGTINLSAGQRSDAGSSIASDFRGMDFSNATQGQIQRRIKFVLSRKDYQLKRFERFCKRFSIAAVIIGIAETIVNVYFVKFFLAESNALSRVLSAGHYLTVATLASLQAVFFPSTVVEEGLDVSGVIEDSISSMEGEFSTLLSQDFSFVTSADTLGLLHDAGKVSFVTDGEKGIENGSFSILFRVIASHFHSFISDEWDVDSASCGDSCHFVLNNGAGDLPQAVLDISSSHEATCSRIIDAMNLFDDIMLTVAMLCVLVGICVGFLPVVILAEKKQRNIGEALLAIPPKAVKKIRKQIEFRLNRFSSASDFGIHLIQADFDADYHEVEEEEDALEGVVEVQETSFKKSFHQRRHSSSSASSKVSPLLGPRKRVKSPLLRRVFEWFRLSARVGGLFLVVISFFVFLAVSSAVHGEYIMELGAGLRVSSTLLVVFPTLEFYNGLPSHLPGWMVDRSEESVSEKAIAWSAKADLLLDAMRYGNASLGLPILTDYESEQYQFLFSDACGTWCLDHLQGEENKTLGALKHGLLYALEYHQALSRKIIETRKLVHLNATDSDALQALRDLQTHHKGSLQPRLYLFDQMRQASKYFHDSLRAQVGLFTREKIIAGCIFVVILTLLFTYTLRVTDKMSVEINSVKAILLITPPALFRSVPELQNVLN